MNLRERFRERLQPIYFLGQNPVTLTGAVIATSAALSTVAFWFYDIFLPGPPHPYVGILVFLILPGFFVLGLLLISNRHLATATKSASERESTCDLPGD
jgi:hypothetical protein